MIGDVFDRDSAQPAASAAAGLPLAAGSRPPAAPHPMAAFDAERRPVLDHRAAEVLRRRQGLWTLAKRIVDGTGPPTLAVLEQELAAIGAAYEELRPIVDMLVAQRDVHIAQRDASRRAVEADEQELRRARAQQASLAADEAARAAQLQRVLEATGATPVDLSATSRRLRESSCRQPTILPNENAP